MLEKLYAAKEEEKRGVVVESSANKTARASVNNSSDVKFLEGRANAGPYVVGHPCAAGRAE